MVVVLLTEQAILDLRSTSASEGVASVVLARRVKQATLELRSSCASDGVASVVVALLEEQAALALRSTSASEGVASVAVALRVEQATFELRSSCASQGVASVAVVLLVEQATLELRSTSASNGGASVAVALLEEQATLELRSTSAPEGVASVAVALVVRAPHRVPTPSGATRCWLLRLCLVSTSCAGVVNSSGKRASRKQTRTRACEWATRYSSRTVSSWLGMTPGPLVYIASAKPATVREKIKEIKALFFHADSSDLRAPHRSRHRLVPWRANLHDQARRQRRVQASFLAGG